jgi:hypothetical protein
MSGESISQVPPAVSISGSELVLISVPTGNPSVPFLTKSATTQQVGNQFQNNLNVSLVYEMDGGGGTIAIGVQGYIVIPWAANISAVEMLTKQSGSFQMDVWRTTYSLFDAGVTHPVSADSITGGVYPTISSGVKYSGTTSGWTQNLNAGDILAFVVLSNLNIGHATLALTLNRNF